MKYKCKLLLPFLVFFDILYYKTSAFPAETCCNQLLVHTVNTIFLFVINGIIFHYRRIRWEEHLKNSLSLKSHLYSYTGTCV